MSRKLALVALTSAIAFTAISSQSGETTLVARCAPIGMCFCVNPVFEQSIASKTSEIEKLLTDARQNGKATIYLSTPLSTRGGSQFGVNRDAALDAAKKIGKRLGENSVLVLNPVDFDLEKIDGQRAGQGDYMLLWANIVGGRTGLAELLDAVYFMGPFDYAAYFGLTGTGDLERLGLFFDQRKQQDKSFADDIAAGKVSRLSFVTYYGLRASSAFSAGANDEWNVVARVNEARRKSAYGLGGQLAILSGNGTPEVGDYDDIAPKGNESVACATAN